MPKSVPISADMDIKYSMPVLIVIPTSDPQGVEEPTKQVNASQSPSNICTIGVDTAYPPNDSQKDNSKRLFVVELNLYHTLAAFNGSPQLASNN